MAQTPMDMMMQANEREQVFATRTRYYQALNAGLTKTDAFAYANDPSKKLSDFGKEEPVVAPVLNKPAPEEVITPPDDEHVRAPETATLPETPVSEDQVSDVPVAAQEDLTQINGIGSGTARRLATKGITTFIQLASLSDADVAQLDAELGLRGRITREDWVGQANAIVAGE